MLASKSLKIITYHTECNFYRNNNEFDDPNKIDHQDILLCNQPSCLGSILRNKQKIVDLSNKIRLSKWS